MQTVIGAFDDRATAERAVVRLHEAGFDRKDVHLEQQDQVATPETTRTTEEDRGGWSFFRHLFGGEDRTGSPRHLPQWHLLTASPADLHELWSFLHVYVRKVDGDGGAGGAPRSWRTGRRLTYDVDHSDDVFFIDPDGRERWVFPDQPYLHGARIPARMQRFMTAGGRRNEQRGSWTTDEGLTVLRWIRATS